MQRHTEKCHQDTPDQGRIEVTAKIEGDQMVVRFGTLAPELQPRTKDWCSPASFTPRIQTITLRRLPMSSMPAVPAQTSLGPGYFQNVMVSKSISRAPVAATSQRTSMSARGEYLSVSLSATGQIVLLPERSFH